jgi:beta-galactosidase
MHIGTSYYPEHFPREEWAKDLDNMRALGLDCVRIAEFAWSRMEPAEGVFDFAWLEAFCDLARARGLGLVLCTPTAAPPRWLSFNYPEILPLDANGNVKEDGGRKHFCPSSEKYRHFCRRITREMAQRFAARDGVVTWQVDNEMSSPMSYSPEADRRFTEWLRSRYGDLATLNRAWGTYFWSCDYSDWAQIRIPRPALGGKSATSKAVFLDMKRFWSDEMISYMNEQVAILREYFPDTPLTTNWSPIQDYGIDFHEMARHLDFPSWDNYVPDPGKAAFCHEFVDGCNPNGTGFWVMEQQATPPDSGRVNPLQPDGWLTDACAQAIRHGARGIVFFHWREFPYGTETEHGALTRLDGSTETRVMKEIRAALPGWRKLAADVSRKPAEVGVLMDYENWWALSEGLPYKIKRRNRTVDYRELVARWYGDLTQQDLRVRLTHPSGNWEALPVVVIPTAPIVSETLASRLRVYVENGGCLVIGPQTGVWDANANPLGHFALADLCGCVPTESDCFWPDATIALAPSEKGLPPDTPTPQGRLWADILRADGAEPLLYYSERFYAGATAATLRQVGKGTVCYLGIYPGEGLVKTILHLLGSAVAQPSGKTQSDPLDTHG